MLAPVLVRLTQLPGVADARVECSGTFFLLTGAAPGALEEVLPAIGAVLGPSMRRVEGTAREEQLSRRDRGELWFSKDDIRGLSYVEARVLSMRMTDAVNAAVALDSAGAEQLASAVRAEIFAAIDHAHDLGGHSSSGWFWKEWPRIVERIATRLRGAMPDGQRGECAATLVAQAPRG